ncbi:hypothetical protein [Mammaliicoccus sciuri]|uniref:hypothetical protein n=1 Tax=Mammaliicoccus sciuri TaxID=1296 RepID=UPI0021D349A6|nr:hypothetical protein [Mammaliicoccus sciuri]UXU70182.1 hypothetical protein MUA36_05735 [Mammaliicoccus sciuri]
MKKVKEIELVLENCEYIKIPTNHLANLIIEDIDISVRRTAMNSIDKIQTANSIYIEITEPETIKTIGFFDEDDERSPNCFERLTEYEDITSVIVIYDDDTKENYYVDSDWDNGYRNRCQDTSLWGGILSVLINRNKSLKEFLNDGDEGFWE